jgi:hypothetical protein
MCGNDRGVEPVVCAGCAARGLRDLDDLPRLATRIITSARSPGRTAGDRVSGTREAPMPLRADLWSFVGLGAPGDVSAPDLKDAECQVGDVPLPDALWSWCRAAADDLGVTVPAVRRQHPLLAVRRFTSVLATQHERICRRTWADEYLTEVHDMWRRARTLAQDWSLVHNLPAPCPYCWTLTLRRDDGASFVYCDHRHGGCGRRWVEADYQRLVLILASEAKESGWVSTGKAST